MIGERSQRRGRVASYFSGFFSGIIVAVIIGLASGLYLLKNPPVAVMKVANAGVSRVIRKVNASMPKAYMAKNQNEISDLLSRFVKAYANGKISPEDMDILTQKAFEASADQKITEQEIRQMLDLIKKYASQA